MIRATTLSLVIAATGCETDWIDPMERQKRYKPYEVNPLFSDERAMRPLVPGTIAREQPIGPPAFTTGLVSNAYVTHVPMPLTTATLALGRKKFEIACAPCHGLAGDGKSVVATKMSLRPPPSLIDDPIARYPPGRVFHSVSLGYGLMASYAAELSVSERWAVVAYWQVLASRNVPIDEAPPDVRERLQRIAK